MSKHNDSGDPRSRYIHYDHIHLDLSENTSGTVKTARPGPGTKAGESFVVSVEAVEQCPSILPHIADNLDAVRRDGRITVRFTRSAMAAMTPERFAALRAQIADMWPCTPILFAESPAHGKRPEVTFTVNWTM